ncbi:MAG: TIGR03808 family TAT-translocated repetitive protein [Cucumibacter sp.]
MQLSRRLVITGIGAAALAPFAVRAQAAGMGGALLATDLGIDPASSEDQSAAIQAAIDTAAAEGRGLFLPGGTYRIGALRLASASMIGGVPGATRLLAIGDAPALTGSGLAALTLEGFTLDGGGLGPNGNDTGLLALANCGELALEALTLENCRGHALHLENSFGTVRGCAFRHADAGLFSLDAKGLLIEGNSIADCANAGVLVWGSAAGPDGTIVTGNRIARIASLAGGNGQNGNGVNVFRAGGVIVADNQISDCAFSAVRVNGADDSQIRGNVCRSISEVAIFSEFGFSGSVIADNIVDVAAGGISMTNFDAGGHLATCSGNIVRNVTRLSATNPDTVPFGIFAEADAAISGNLVDSVPGIGIGAGWGPYLRDVSVSANVVRETMIGIGVSVAEGAGAASITGNLVSGARLAAIAGMEWSEIAEPDLVANAGRYPQLNVAGNLVR